MQDILDLRVVISVRIAVGNGVHEHEVIFHYSSYNVLLSEGCLMYHTPDLLGVYDQKFLESHINWRSYYWA